MWSAGLLALGLLYRETFWDWFRLLKGDLEEGLGMLVDLPGYGFARVPEHVRKDWKRLVDSYLNAERSTAVFLMLVDARHKPMNSDVELWNWLCESRRPRRVVLTKADAVSGSRLGQTVKRAREVLDFQDGAEPPLPVSARTGKGIKNLRALIHQAVNR